MISAIVVAAGSSRRMGFDKIFALLHGKPVLYWSLAAFEQCECVDEILVVTREEHIAAVEKIVRAEKLTKVRRVVAGGSERHLSVWNGLKAVKSEGASLWRSTMAPARS